MRIHGWPVLMLFTSWIYDVELSCKTPYWSKSEMNFSVIRFEGLHCLVLFMVHKVKIFHFSWLNLFFSDLSSFLTPSWTNVTLVHQILWRLIISITDWPIIVLELSIIKVWWVLQLNHWIYWHLFDISCVNPWWMGIM